MKARLAAWESELSAGSTDTKRRARLAFEIGSLYENTVGDLKKASASYQVALEASPEHLPSLRGLRRVSIARKSWQAALPLFDREIRLVADASRKATLLLMKGRLLEEAFDKRADARQAYEAAFELDRGHHGVLRALAERYADDKSWDALERVLERAANAVTSDPRHRAILVVERARLAELRAQEPERAVELYETALRLDPRAPGALAALKRLYQTQRRWRDLARVLEAEAELAKDVAVRVAALVRAGKLHAHRLGNRADGVARLEAAAELAPDDPEVLSALAVLYEEGSRWDALATTLEALSRVTADRSASVVVMLRLAAVHQHRLGNPDQAMRWLAAALALDPLDEEALQSLEALYLEHERWRELATVRRAEAEATRDAGRRARALQRVAELHERALEDAAGAIDHHAKALAASPTHAPSFDALDRLYAAAGRWHDLVALHEAAVDRAPDAIAKIVHLFRIGAVHEDQLGDPARALMVYRRALELEPTHLGALRALQRAATRAGRRGELVAALEKEAGLVKDATRRAELLFRAAEASALDDREGAVAYYRKVLELAPTHVGALVGLEGVQRALGRWEDLAETIERRVPHARGVDAAKLLHELATLSFDRLGRESAGLKFLRRAIDAAADYVPPRLELERRLEARKDWKALASFLEEERKRAGDEARVGLTARLAAVREEHLDDGRGALAAWEQVLELRPGDPTAIDAVARLRVRDKAWGAHVADLAAESVAREDAYASIDASLREAMVLASEVDDPKRAALKLESVLARDPTNVAALHALEAIYRRLGQWDALARVLAAQSRTSVDPAARVAALQRQAAIAASRGLGSPEDLAAIHDEVLRIDPLQWASLEALEALALAMGDRARLAMVDERLAALADDPSARAFHLTRRGESLEALERPEALRAFQSALEQDPESLAATAGFSRVARQLDEPNLLAEAARREAEVAFRPAEVADALVRSASVRLERLGDVEGALEDLERALEVLPSSEPAALGLARILRERGETQRLADRLAHAATTTDVAHRRPALWLEVAAIEADELGNLNAAIAAVQRVLREVPTHVPALGRLAEYQTRAGEHEAAAEALGRLVQQRPAEPALVAAHLELADLWAHRLSEPARALVSLQAVLAIDPAHVGALERLAEIEESAGRLEEARAAALRAVEVIAEPGARAQALLRLARIESARGVDEASLDALVAAAALEGPGSESALELKSRCQRVSDWERYASALEQFLAGQAPERAAPTYLELSRVLHDALARPKAAVELLERALAATQSATVQRELGVRLRGVGRQDDAVVTFQALCAREPQRAEHWRELSQTFLLAGARREARIAAEPLGLLGVMTDAERALLGQEPARPAHARPGSLAEAIEHLGTPSREQVAAGALLRSVETALPKLFPPDLESFGLVARDRLTSRTGHPLRALAERIATVLGLEAFDLYVHQERQRGVGVEMGTPAALIVPAALAELPLPQQTFALTRLLVQIARGLPLVEKLTPREIEVLLASAARQVRPGFGGGLTSEEILDEQSKRLYKALGRRQRKQMEEAAAAYIDAGRVDFPRWVRGAQRTATRVAALLADDLAASLSALRGFERDMVGTGPALLEASDVARDLVVFWGSAPAMHLRRHAGLLGGAS
ncbi:MAG: hypothetical protein KF901_29645 [Myxococcales bacterium]|nr:hypothetical protein [Myxococcales bacterium]